jgi:hypothetical protein
MLPVSPSAIAWPISRRSWPLAWPGDSPLRRREQQERLVDDEPAIETAWRERLVVVFHGQSLSDPQLITFSENLGELDPPGPNPYGEPFNKAHPEVNIISNVVENGKPIGASATARRCGTPI